MADIAALDLWTIFVSYTFGSFLLAIMGIALLLFIIMAIFGKMSIYSVTWYIIMFADAMTLGYGYVLANVLVTTALLVAFFFSWRNYFDK